MKFGIDIHDHQRLAFDDLASSSLGQCNISD